MAMKLTQHRDTQIIKDDEGRTIALVIPAGGMKVKIFGSVGQPIWIPRAALPALIEALQNEAK